MKIWFSRASEKIRSHFFSRFFEIETLVNDCCGVERGIYSDIYENMVKVQETKTIIYLIRSDVCPPFHYWRYVELFEVWFLNIFFSSLFKNIGFNRGREYVQVQRILGSKELQFCSIFLFQCLFFCSIFGMFSVKMPILLMLNQFVMNKLFVQSDYVSLPCLVSNGCWWTDTTDNYLQLPRSQRYIHIGQHLTTIHLGRSKTHNNIFIHIGQQLTDTMLHKYR